MPVQLPVKYVITFLLSFDYSLSDIFLCLLVSTAICVKQIELPCLWNALYNSKCHKPQILQINSSIISSVKTSLLISTICLNCERNQWNMLKHKDFEVHSSQFSQAFIHCEIQNFSNHMCLTLITSKCLSVWFIVWSQRVLWSVENTY